MKKIEKLEKYMLAPDLCFNGGFIYDGEDIDLGIDSHSEYEVQEDKTEKEIANITITDKIIDNKLIKHISRWFYRKSGEKVTNDTNTTIEIKKGQLIVFIQGNGYDIPKYKMITVPEVIEQYNILNTINDEPIKDE